MQRECHWEEMILSTAQSLWSIARALATEGISYILKFKPQEEVTSTERWRYAKYDIVDKM